MKKIRRQKTEDRKRKSDGLAFAVRHGMQREEALKAVTITPAEILGVADRVGSLEEGKDADIVILNGDPLNVKTRVEKVILNGKTVYTAD